MNEDLYNVYDGITILVNGAHWSILNDLFIMWEQQAWRTDVNRLIVYAEASLSGKDKIWTRKVFLRKCKELHSDQEQIWKRLE